MQDERYLLLQKSKSLIGFERDLAAAAANVVTQVVTKQDNPSKENKFRLHESLAQMLYAMNVMLTKDNGVDETNRLYSEILDIRYNRNKDKKW